MKTAVSVIIPAHNEESSVRETVESVAAVLTREHIAFEIIVVNDHSTDATVVVLKKDLAEHVSQLRVLDNEQSRGFGTTVVTGINAARGKYVAIMMADCSDDPEDLVRFYRAAEETGVDCVFGSRFIKGGATYDYPRLKLAFNRLANMLVRLLFHTRYNDYTNAFKLYKQETLGGLRPFLSQLCAATVILLFRILGTIARTELRNSKLRKWGVATCISCSIASSNGTSAVEILKR
jgi:dolichol-phosphate mannosyltransferase